MMATQPLLPPITGRREQSNDKAAAQHLPPQLPETKSSSIVQCHRSRPKRRTALGAQRASDSNQQIAAQPNFASINTVIAIGNSNNRNSSSNNSEIRLLTSTTTTNTPEPQPLTCTRTPSTDTRNQRRRCRPSGGAPSVRLHQVAYCTGASGTLSVLKRGSAWSLNVFALLCAVALAACADSTTTGKTFYPLSITQSLMGGGLRQRRPDSSSSFYADVEDLSDSTIKTRVGSATIVQNTSALSNIEHLGNLPADFERLIERIAPNQQQEQLTQIQFNTNEQQPHQFNVSGDANNRTTMRFLRNNKTFASIVHTNEPYTGGGTRQPRKLINCHLVDLEKHANDVVLYEAKYDIKTIDVEFKDMMQIIEACTNVARMRTKPVNFLISHASQPNAAQLFTAGPANGVPGGQKSGLTTTYSSGSSPSASSGGGGGMKPLLVVGRPLPVALPMVGASGGGGDQQQQTVTAGGGANSLATYKSVMASALNKELQRLGPSATLDDSNKLDLPQSRVAATNAADSSSMGQQWASSRSFGIDSGGQRVQRRSSNQMAPTPQQQQRQQQQQQLRAFLLNSNENNSGQVMVGSSGRGGLTRAVSAPRAQSKSQALLTKALAKVGETSKRLVLGEVTAPPAAVDGSHGGGLREALQEITNYDTTDLMAIWRGILPGTNWCGMGDRATSYNDLGFEADIDICCRAHDFCPIRLAAFSSGYGLFNWSFYTRSHCWCDQNFLDCLQQAESPLSTVVMKFYFSIMKTTCLNDNETNLASTNSSIKSVGGSSTKSGNKSRSANVGLVGGGSNLSWQPKNAHPQRGPASPPLPTPSPSSVGWQLFRTLTGVKNNGQKQQQQQQQQQQQMALLTLANEHPHQQQKQLQQIGPPIPALKQSLMFQNKAEPGKWQQFRAFG